MLKPSVREPFVRGIVRSSLFNLASKAVLFCTFLVLAYYFGTGEKTDVYFFLYSTLWLVVTIFSSLHVAVIVPEAMRRREQEGEKQGMQFFNYFFYIFLAIAGIGLVLFYIQPVTWVALISKFDFSILQGYRSLILGFLPLFPLIIACQYLVDLLNAYRYFTIPVLTGLFNNVIAFVLLFALHSVLDIYAMLWAAYIAYGINLLLLLYLMRRDLSWRFGFTRVSVGGVFRANFGIGFLGNVGNFLGKYAANYFCSGADAGLLTAYSYGQRTTNQPTEIITNQFSSVAAIRFNELVAQSNRAKLKTVFHQSVNMLLFILVPVAVIFFFYAQDIITILYQRGAFDAEAAKQTAFFARYLGFLIPLMGLNTVVTRLYNAGQIIRFSTIYSLIANGIQVLLLWFAYSRWGIWGLPFALLAQNVLNVLVAQIFLRIFFKGIGYSRALVMLAGLTLLCLGLVFGLRSLADLLPWHYLLKMGLACLLFAVMYLGVNKVFKINRDVSHYLRKWIGLK